jgi:hypothetical protein
LASQHAKNYLPERHSPPRGSPAVGEQRKLC